MSREIEHNKHRAEIDLALKEAYQAVNEAKALIQQHDNDSTMLAVVESVAGRLDRVEVAITLMHGDVLELSGIVQELRQQRDDTLKLVRAVMGRLMQ